MTRPTTVVCDACGQSATPEHVARRLRRLEWATRYRPIHIGTLFLAAVAPENDDEYLYAGSRELQQQATRMFAGEAAQILQATGISPQISTSLKGPTLVDAILAEFQRRGYFLTHVLECPLEGSTREGGSSAEILLGRVPSVLVRIRRSLRPKRIALVSSLLEPYVESFRPLGPGCELVLDEGKAFGLDGPEREQAARHLLAELERTSSAR